MAELLRLQMRDGRWLSGGFQGVPGGGLHAVSGDPTYLETFAIVAPAVLPLIDGGPVALAVCDQNFQPTAQLMVIDAHFKAPPHGLGQWLFGGPGTVVLCWDTGPVPPTDQDTYKSNLFGAALDPQGELSIQVTGSRDFNWYFRVGVDGFVYADGTVPFGDDTAFRILLGPPCASVSGQVIDANSMQPLPNAQLTTDRTNPAFSDTNTPKANGDFSLHDPDNATCVPAGPLVITTTELTHVSATTHLTVPGSGAINEQIALTCRVLQGTVTDDQGNPQSGSMVILLDAHGNPVGLPANVDKNTGAFSFVCIPEGSYTLIYPGATPLPPQNVPDAGLSGVHLIVPTARLQGHVTDATTNPPVGLFPATVQVLGTTATTDAAGAYSMSGLTSGTKLGTASMSRYASRTDSITLIAGQIVIHDFPLQPATNVVQDLFNTGVGSTGAVLAGGANDPHWNITAGPSIPAAGQPAVVLTTQNPGPGFYFGPTGDSAWIWVVANGNGAINAPYTFTLKFNLNAVSGATRLSGGWGCDNNGQILLNGTQNDPGNSGVLTLGGGAFTNFGRINFFDFAGPFLVGVNTLEVQVTDTGNPGGLNVTGLTLQP
jgi:hypothetical protein